MIKVILIDDHPIFIRGLSGLLASAGDIEVVAEAYDGLVALRVASEIAWDVAVLDASLPRLNGMELLRRLVAAYPGRKVLMLSQYPENQFGARAVGDGAAGYISKSGPPERVIDAIRSVASGRPLPAPEPSVREGDGAPVPPHETLTPREYQVFILVAGGRGVTEVAAELNMAASTVSNHLWHIKQKLGASTLGAIVAYAHRVGLVE